MKSHSQRFNTYLMAALALAIVCGCQSDEGRRKRENSTFRLHLETNDDGSNLVETVPVDRAQPILVTVERPPFLTEANIIEAKVFDSLGGFSVSVKFDRQGAWILDQYTVANRGRHFAVFSQWTPKVGEKINKGRWLAAPKVTDHIVDGLFIFTPDASREEADQIVLGLNNVARKLNTASKYNF